jgi:hypothetical protein
MRVGGIVAAGMRRGGHTLAGCHGKNSTGAWAEARRLGSAQI